MTNGHVVRSRPRGARAVRWIGAGAIAALLGASLAAHAQPTAAERTQAEALFNEGKKLQKDGQIAEACRKFEASYRIDAAGGTVLNLGLCHEKEGKLASAWAELKEALASAKKANRKDREKIARERIDAIEPRLPYVTVIADKPDLSGLAVTVDDVAIEREAWGAQLPMDPGKHTLKATAPGHQDYEAPFEVEEAKKITVRVPALRAAKPAPTASATATAPAGPPPARFPWMRPSGIAVGSVGLVAIGVGAAFGASALSAGGKARSECDATFGCTPAGLAAVEDGRTSATAADILIGAGAGLTAVGVAMFVIGGLAAPAESAPPSDAGGASASKARARAARAVKLTPVAKVGATGAVLGLEGAW